MTVSAVSNRLAKNIAASGALNSDAAVVSSQFNFCALQVDIGSDELVEQNDPH